MPSYRVTIGIGALVAGVTPDAVLPAAAAGAAALTTVEASDLAVVGGLPRLVVRFTAEDRPDAQQVAMSVLEATRAVAQPLTCTITRRVGGRWIDDAQRP